MNSRDCAHTASGKRRRVPRLRTKLIAALLALLAVVCLLIAVISEFALSGFLTRQVDEQLRETISRATSRDRDTRHDHDDALAVTGTVTGTVHAWFSDGETEAELLTTQPGSPLAQRQRLGPADQAVLRAVPGDGQPRTATLSSGPYRVIAAGGDDELEVFGLTLGPAHDTLLTVGLILGEVAAAAVLGAGIVGAYVVRRTLRPLDRIAAAASRVTELALETGEVALSVRVPVTDIGPSTEVGQVGHALNRMLGHIGQALEARQAGQTRVRQFVADASHELRTPLAAIRGYAELTLRSRDRVPPNVAQAMNRVESEASRMTALVDDLLLLARLEAGHPLEQSEVDLARLVADAVGDARIAAPGHRWRLALPGEPVVVTGDPQRLHQVLANLLANGPRHTPPGTTVTTRLRTADGAAVLTVTDDGPEIPRELLPSAFDRFARGDPARSRAAGSTGLGLPIVAAVVAAHHGTIAVRSSAGHTEFEVRLPRAHPVATRA